MERLQAAHAGSRQIYGSPRIYAELRAQGVACSENTVAKLMKHHGIRSTMRRRFVVRTTDSRHAYRIAANRLAQQFDVPEPGPRTSRTSRRARVGSTWRR